MRVVVTGDRWWADQTTINIVLDGLRQQAEHLNEHLIVAHGGARGADHCAHRWVQHLHDEHVEEMVFEADWHEYGPPAGPMRNRKMLAEVEPDLVVAFHDRIEQSKGTKDCVVAAREQDYPVLHIRHLRELG